MDAWVIAQNEDPARYMALHGWTRAANLALRFRTEQDAQDHIDHRRVAGHTQRAKPEDSQIASGMAGAPLPDYNPFARPAS